MALCVATGACQGTSRQGTVAGPGAGLLPSPPLPGEAPAGTWHTIERGETLSELAARYDVSAQDLAEANDLEDPDRLLAGAELFVPGAEAVRRAPASVKPRRSGKGRPGVRRSYGRFQWPVAGGKLSSRFGRRWGRNHDGIDIAAPTGTPVRAAAAGVVIYSGVQRGYGNLVLLRHDKRWVTVYAHNDANLVRRGDKVRQGEQIARVGSTGRSTGPHLHFEIRDGGRARNPLFFVRAPVAD